MKSASIVEGGHSYKECASPYGRGRGGDRRGKRGGKGGHCGSGQGGIHGGHAHHIILNFNLKY